jgi:hypothetical protein
VIFDSSFDPPIARLKPENVRTLWLIAGGYANERSASAREIRRRIRILLNRHARAAELAVVANDCEAP